MYPQSGGEEAMRKFYDTYDSMMYVAHSSDWRVPVLNTAEEWIFISSLISTERMFGLYKQIAEEHGVYMTVGNGTEAARQALTRWKALTLAPSFGSLARDPAEEYRVESGIRMLGPFCLPVYLESREITRYEGVGSRPGGVLRRDPRRETREKERSIDPAEFFYQWRIMLEDNPYGKTMPDNKKWHVMKFCLYEPRVKVLAMNLQRQYDDSIMRRKPIEGLANEKDLMATLEKEMRKWWLRAMETQKAQEGGTVDHSLVGLNPSQDSHGERVGGIVLETGLDDSWVDREIKYGLHTDAFNHDREAYLRGGGVCTHEEKSLDLVYDGPDLGMSQHDSVMIPVKVSPTDDQYREYPLSFPGCHMVQSSEENECLSIIPGLWDIDSECGLVTVTWHEVTDCILRKGDKVGEICPVQVQTNVCVTCD